MTAADSNAARTRRRASRRTKSDYAATALARKHSVEAVELLVRIMTGEETHQVLVKDGEDQHLEEVGPELAERLRAAKEILDRGMGKPTQRKELTISLEQEHLKAIQDLAKTVQRVAAPVADHPLIDVTPGSSESGDEAKLRHASRLDAKARAAKAIPAS